MYSTTCTALSSSRTKALLRAWALLLLPAALLPASAPGVPLEVSYQGQLLDSVGLPLTATVPLELRIWSDATSTDPGDLLYEETHAAVSVDAGVFSVALGGGVASVGTFDAGLLAAPALWLETEVDGDVLAPRERLRAVPYAIRAGTAESVASVPAAFAEIFFEQVNLDGGGPGNLDPREGNVDVDDDGLANFLDPDNDGDGFSDTVEIAQGTDMNLPTPAIASLTPTGARATNTTTVLVQGSNFLAGLSVSFGSETPVPQNLTPMSFEVQAGPQPAGTVNVAVANPSGESDIDDATFVFDNRLIVFVTSQTWSGNLGGLAGGDAKCQAAADAVGLGGSFLAWLSDDTDFPASRFSTGGGPYILVTGELFTASLPITTLPAHALDTTEFGAVVSAESVWTNTRASGAPVIGGAHCQNWTSSNAVDQGRVGITTLPFWSFVETRICDEALHLYCFEQ